ncbi:lysophospholipid transporter LplT [Telluria sp. Tellsp104]
MSTQSLLCRPTLRALLGVQLLTALADNALVIVALALLAERGAPVWMDPSLRIALYLSYVLLAPLAGMLADALPKGRLIVLVNLVKLGGCVLLAAHVHPLFAFVAIGLAGVCYGPAKYGILTELIPNADLVRANAWIEIVTVAAMLGGPLLGSSLLGLPLWTDSLRTIARQASLVIASLCALASLSAAAIPATSASTAPRSHPLRQFKHQLAALWRDPQARISIAVTTLFWAVAAVLQFLVLRWAGTVLKLSLSGAAVLLCCLAAGVAAGSLLAARYVAATEALRVLPVGIVLGLCILLTGQVSTPWVAGCALCVTGIVGGLLMVPMNALLQQRGAALMTPGVSIAVQGFSENLGSLVLLVVYGLLLAARVQVVTIIAGFGILVTASMLLIQRHRSMAPPRLLTGK